MDKYDIAADYLTKHPEEIYHAWLGPDSHKYGCLFTFMELDPNNSTPGVGCLTQIRGQSREYFSDFGEEHTKQIIADKRIPIDARDIKPEHFEVFKEYQRDADNRREILKAQGA